MLHRLDQIDRNALIYAAACAEIRDSSLSRLGPDSRAAIFMRLRKG